MGNMGPEPPAVLAKEEMVSARNYVEQLFIHIDESFVITSLPDIYNCISHALDDVTGMIWPSRMDGDWPLNIECTEHVSSFEEMFRRRGYLRCETPAVEAGYDKIALYARDRFVKHAARQLPSGRWSSKLGLRGYDIAHHALTDLEGKRYGLARDFFSRKRTS